MVSSSVSNNSTASAVSSVSVCGVNNVIISLKKNSLRFPFYEIKDNKINSISDAVIFSL